MFFLITFKIPKRSFSMSFKKQYLKSKPICKVSFKLSKEEAKSADNVKLVGDFNDWDMSKMPMKKLKDGSFTLNLELPVDKAFEFKYLLNDKEWENDWEADHYHPTEFGSDNSVIKTHAA